MPTLKDLTCHVEWAGFNTPLEEFRNAYADGYVECYIAVPPFPTPFSIHLTSNGYICSGLAMFVFIDEVYQCNRNRSNLRMPAQGSNRRQTEIDFRVRQKEERMYDGTMLGHEWKFVKSRSADGSRVADGGKDGDEYFGTIEVVVLRCFPTVKSNPTNSAASTNPTKPQEKDVPVLVGAMYDGPSDPKPGSQHTDLNSVSDTSIFSTSRRHSHRHKRHEPIEIHNSNVHIYSVERNGASESSRSGRRRQSRQHSDLSSDSTKNYVAAPLAKASHERSLSDPTRCSSGLSSCVTFTEAPRQRSERSYPSNTLSRKTSPRAILASVQSKGGSIWNKAYDVSQEASTPMIRGGYDEKKPWHPITNPTSKKSEWGDPIEQSQSNSEPKNNDNGYGKASSGQDDDWGAPSGGNDSKVEGDHEHWNKDGTSWGEAAQNGGNSWDEGNKDGNANGGWGQLDSGGGDQNWINSSDNFDNDSGNQAGTGGEGNGAWNNGRSNDGSGWGNKNGHSTKERDENRGSDNWNYSGGNDASWQSNGTWKANGNDSQSPSNWEDNGNAVKGNDNANSWTYGKNDGGRQSSSWNNPDGNNGHSGGDVSSNWQFDNGQSKGDTWTSEFPSSSGIQENDGYVDNLASWSNPISNQQGEVSLGSTASGATVPQSSKSVAPHKKPKTKKAPNEHPGWENFRPPTWQEQQKAQSKFGPELVGGYSPPPTPRAKEETGSKSPTLTPAPTSPSPPSNVTIIKPAPKDYWASWSTVSLFNPSLRHGQSMSSSAFGQKTQPHPYTHKTRTPVYMDNFSEPFAVFVFKYRDVNKIEKLIGRKVAVGAETERERLRGLSRDELIEEVMRGRGGVMAGGSANGDGGWVGTGNADSNPEERHVWEGTGGSNAWRPGPTDSKNRNDKWGKTPKGATMWKQPLTSSSKGGSNSNGGGWNNSDQNGNGNSNEDAGGSSDWNNTNDSDKNGGENDGGGSWDIGNRGDGTGDWKNGNDGGGGDW